MSSPASDQAGTTPTPSQATAVTGGSAWVLSLYLSRRKCHCSCYTSWTDKVKFKQNWHAGKNYTFIAVLSLDEYLLTKDLKVIKPGVNIRNHGKLW